jgi:TonB-dependent SusC/RagA subfamily outer membrane receptor
MGTNTLQSGVANSNRAIDINQDDIESVSILKGPAAAVLYGSRAASGAVVITTKKGATLGTKKQAVTFTSNYNIVKVGRLPDYQNTYAQGNSGIFSPISMLRAFSERVQTFKTTLPSLVPPTAPATTLRMATCTSPASCQATY